MLSRMDLCFFDDIRSKKRKYKRYRKPPELLPFSVRLTGLSGAVRVEAYLKQQQKAKEIKNKEETPDKVDQDQGEPTEDPGPAGGEQNQTVLNNLYKLGNDLKQESEEKKTDRKNIHLPNISLRNLGNTGIKSFEQLEGDDEEEDTQRFLFEENKFAAPNLLAQLGKLIDFVHGKQVDELEDILSTSSQLSGSPVLVEEPENEVTETLRSGGVVIQLPDDLSQKLLNNYEGLSANAVYVKREWQTASYREQAILQKRLGTTDIQQLLEAQKPDTTNQVTGTTMDALNKKDNEKIKTSDSKDALKKTIKKDAETNELVGAKLLTNKESVVEGTASQILSLRKESRASNVFVKPKTRIEKFKYYADKGESFVSSPGRSRKASTQMQHLGYSGAGAGVGSATAGGGSTARGPRGSVAHEHVYFEDQTFDEEFKETSEVPSTQLQASGVPSVINFSLLSKQCEDRGWIVHQSDADDLERTTMIEWARARLLQVIKERDEAEVKAKELGDDGPVVQKFYGDSQLEAALKYKKGVSWAKRWKKMTENEKKAKFLIGIPDGTTYCYYPSGRVAVCAIRSGVGLPGKYTFVYGDTDEQPMLASFLPTGVGCCHSATGTIKFIATHKFGALMEDGKVEKKWKWPLGKLQSAVVVSLNQYIYLRCISQTGLTLYYSCQNESTKFPVGMANGAKTVRIEDLGFLQTENKFTSLAAIQSIKVKPKKKEKRKRGQKQPKVEVITEEVLEERRKELEEKFPERKEIETDAPWQLDLMKLQRKVKNLVYDWMDHYRISVGITAPHRASSRAQQRRLLAHSARSLPGAMPSGMHHTRGTPPGRSPSAPPIPRAIAMTKFGSRRGTASPSRSSYSAVPGSRTDRPFDGDGNKGVIIDVPQDGQNGVYLGKTGSIASGSRSHSMALSRLPFRCGVAQQPRSVTPPKSGCCVALRAEILGDQFPQCRCDRRRIPLITDLEYDIFLQEHVAKTQMVVVSVTSSSFPDANPCDSMLDKLFYEGNRNRSIPCVQARHDPYRLLRYDIAIAARDTDHAQPLLLTRHNAVPGMFLMYIGGKLLFADHIFNGYGNARKDFLKQIMKTRKDSLAGNALPYDFRLSPTRGRSGPRAAWGGEIGGPKISTSQLAIHSEDNSRITSASTQDSKSTTSVDVRRGAQSATSFVNLGLSIDSPYPMTPRRMDGSVKELPKLNTVA